MNPTRIFGNNCEFISKHSASPSLGIKVRNILANTPRTLQIFNITNQTNNPLNFNMFFKIWPVVETVPVMGVTNWIQLRNDCDAMKYEKLIYERLLDVPVVNSKITPMIGNSVCQFSFIDLANIMGITHYDPDYNAFLYVFANFITDVAAPQPGFDYNAVPNQSHLNYMRMIETQVKFECIILPYINDMSTLQNYFLNANVYMQNNINVQSARLLYSYNMYKVLYSVYEGIAVLQNHDIVHNDLHFGNILVQDIGNTFIFDFDRSYCQALLVDNPMLNNDPCSFLCRFGQCSRYSPFTDCLKIMHGIIQVFDTSANRAVSDIGLDIIFRVLFLGQQDQVIRDIINMLRQNQFLTDSVTNCCYIFNRATSHEVVIQTIFTIMGVDPVNYILTNLSNQLALMGYARPPVIPPVVPIPVVNSISQNPRWYFGDNKNQKFTQDFGDIIRENDFKKYPPGSIQ